jgi:hypothetical protein
MPVETPSLFAEVIKDHLELKQRNSRLDGSMPIDRYKVEDPFSNHPLFKTEEQARLEETMDGVEPDFTDANFADGGFAESPVETVLAWPGETTAVEEPAADQPSAELEDSGFWRADRARDFDWGD